MPLGICEIKIECRFANWVDGVVHRVSKYFGFVLAVFFLAGGCATQSDGFFPPLNDIRAAAVTAAKDPHVWIPTLAAAAVTVGNLDNKIAEDAREHQRLFSDPQGSSDDLRDISAGFYLLTTLADRDASFADKGLKFGKDVVSIASAHVLTSGLKTAVGRERPGMDNHESFPSGHGTRLGGLTYLTNRNLANLSLPNGVRMAGTLTNYGVATAGAWARVEAGKHHPSDVLFGFAFGHFTTQFVRNAFFAPDRVDVSYQALPEGGAITVGLRF